MPIIIEHISGPTTTLGDNPGATVVYRIFGTDSEPTARALLLATAPLTYSGLLRFGGSVKPIGPNAWEATSEYRLGQRDTDTDPMSENADFAPSESDAVTTEFSADISAGTIHVTQSLETMDQTKVTGDPRALPNFNRAINVTKDAVEGVDIDSTEMTFTESWTFLIQHITWEYIKRLRDLRGKTNNATFRSFAAGELRFYTANLAKQGTDKIKITYTFKVGKNETGVVVADGFTPIDKGAWQYIWCVYENVADNGKLITKPYGAYIERMFEPGDFSLLGIGG